MGRDFIRGGLLRGTLSLGGVLLFHGQQWVGEGRRWEFLGGAGRRGGRGSV